MANHLVRFAVQQCRSRATPVLSQVRGAHHEHHEHHAVVDPVKVVIGKREVVGFGMNGQPNYLDRVDFPMPAIRYKEVTPEIQVIVEHARSEAFCVWLTTLSNSVQVLREKEKGDWRKLTIEEKKALYRASFCQTFAEIKAPTGEWKAILGYSLIGVSLACWIFIWMKCYGEINFSSLEFCSCIVFHSISYSSTQSILHCQSPSPPRGSKLSWSG